jgi:hypothetical protein
VAEKHGPKNRYPFEGKTAEVNFWINQSGEGENLGEACSILACLTAVLNNLNFVNINDGSPIENFIPKHESTGLQENLDIGRNEEMI